MEEQKLGIKIGAGATEFADKTIEELKEEARIFNEEQLILKGE